MKVKKDNFYWVQWKSNPNQFYLVRAKENSLETRRSSMDDLVDVEVICDTRADPLPDIGHTPKDKMHEITDEWMKEYFEDDFPKMRRVMRRIFLLGFRGEEDGE